MIERRTSPNICPNCGFPLRYLGGKLWCAYCRTYPLEKEIDIGGLLSKVEDRLKGTLERIERRLGGEAERPFGDTYQQVLARTNLPPPRVTITTPMTREPLPSTADTDDRVFNYIEAHRGEISISRAASELDITVTELQAAIGRLRSAGLLGLQDEQAQASPVPPLRQKVCVNCSRLIEREARYCTECGSEQPA